MGFGNICTSIFADAQVSGSFVLNRTLWLFTLRNAFLKFLINFIYFKLRFILFTSGVCFVLQWLFARFEIFSMRSTPNQKRAPNLSCETTLPSFIRRGVFPRYAQIVWAKIQHFRWWPCEIIHARNAPINILNMVHPEGTFPIHFLGSGEYQWIARGCVLPYETGLKTSATKDNRGTKSVERAFTRGQTAFSCSCFHTLGGIRDNSSFTD